MCLQVCGRRELHELLSDVAGNGAYPGDLPAPGSPVMICRASFLNQPLPPGSSPHNPTPALADRYDCHGGH